MPTKIRAIGLVQIQENSFKATLEYASAKGFSYEVNKSILEQMCNVMASKNTILLVTHTSKGKFEIASDIYEFACQIIENNKELIRQEEKTAYLTISRLVLRLDKVSTKLAINFLRKYLDVKTFDTHIIELCRSHLKYIFLHKGISEELKATIQDILSSRSSLSQFNIFTRPSFSPSFSMMGSMDPVYTGSHAYKAE